MKPALLCWEAAPQQALRQGDWKAYRPAPGKPLQLYNLAEDLGETTDLVSQRPGTGRHAKGADGGLARRVAGVSAGEAPRWRVIALNRECGTMRLGRTKYGSAVLIVSLTCAGAALSVGAQQPGEAKKQTAPKEQAKKAAQEQRATTNAKIRELLQERYKTLETYVAIKETAYETAGTTDITQVLQAKELLAGAELELAESDEQRIAVHEKAVELAKEIEKHTAVRAEVAGRDFNPSDLPAAKAHRLAAEIAYERAKARLAADQ